MLNNFKQNIKTTTQKLKVLSDLPQIQLKYQKTLQNTQISQKLTLLTDNKYRPSPFLSHSFLQSLFNVRYSRNLIINYKREYIKLSDGGQISLDWANPINNQNHQEYEPSPDTKILFIIHGLTGGSNMNYIKSIVQEGQKQAFRCVAFNSRGVNTELSTPYPFNGICLKDLDYSMNLVHQRYPKADIFAVGASYGANMLIRWAGNVKGSNFLKGIVGLSTPFCIKQCIQSMGYIYEGFFVQLMKNNCINPHKEILEKLKNSHGICLNKLQKTRTIKEFHSEFTVKLYGFNSVDEYFNLSDITNTHTQNIQVPTLLMHSKDDPIVTYKCVPQEQLLENKNIIQVETSHGAHVCWYYGKQPKRVYNYIYIYLYIFFHLFQKSGILNLQFNILMLLYSNNNNNNKNYFNKIKIISNNDYFYLYNKNQIEQRFIIFIIRIYIKCKQLIFIFVYILIIIQFLCNHKTQFFNIQIQ
ncbi:hypothetical protein IMG5_195470 [Ichthyophthirius multifiliis]|uniref:AB hydrolase-1 domain-containing protein n=1 Tax=Ichthyophthirius multifiliis TaxID=5932 RepID=G0R4Y2_ICHMU|nr:hypothetical protein IMG5_195470 [Ichthyophthirius multifiliis]EGR27466.1 hypothetical protein IMG5_195470 [Ichthyophthirius multifiliis]|eukprot:XP_004024376.1 hypothetical protein IMG5_195470 [Ichthyophthirius multifiliis]